MAELLDSPVNVLPFGLLDLFEVKSQGRYPSRLAGTIQGGLDLFRLYADQQAVEIATPVSTIVAAQNGGQISIPATETLNLGNGATVQVPQTEIWCFLEGSVRWTFNDALQNTQFCWSYTPSTTNARAQQMTSHFSGAGPITGVTITERISAVDHPVWLMPGTFLNLWTSGIAVGAGQVTMTANARLLRLQR